MRMESVRRGPSPDSAGPPDGATKHDLRGRNRLPFNRLFNICGGDLAKGLLSEADGVTAAPWDVDGREVGVGVPGELRGAGNEIAFDVPLEVLRRDLRERRLCRHGGWRSCRR